ncbi:MAG: flagellar basal body P-ring formation chaperone FlgA [Campylobacterales bacterium]|nr:flagellar basal body P-ring formation chaperone FlgA [Campylobacterales bacterium]
MYIKIFLSLLISLQLFAIPLKEESKIESAIKELYEKSYQDIKINKISIYSRGSIKSFDSNYDVNIKENSSLSKKGIIYIRTEKNIKIFFDYVIDAEVSVYFTRKTIEKGAELSTLNIIKKSIPLDKFRFMPVRESDLDGSQSKNQLRENQIITLKDIESVVLVKRGEGVSVKIDDEEVSVSLNAEALKDGRLGDIITVKKSDGKNLKVKVIGQNRVEIR